VHATVLDYFFVAHQVRPSQIAAAALMNVTEAVLPNSSTTPDLLKVLQQHTRNHLFEDQVNMCRQRLWCILENADHRNFHHVSLAASSSPTSISSPYRRVSLVGIQIFHPITPNQSPTSMVGIDTHAPTDEAIEAFYLEHESGEDRTYDTTWFSYVDKTEK